MKSTKSNKEKAIAIAYQYVFIVTQVIILLGFLTSALFILDGAGLISAQSNYRLLVLSDTENYFVNKGKVIDESKYNVAEFKANVAKAAEITEGNIQSIYSKQLQEVDEDFINSIGKTLDNYVQPVNNNVYFFTVAGDLIQVSKYSSDQMDFNQIGSINFMNNTSDFPKIVESVDYYGICDNDDNFDPSLDSLLAENSDYQLDNVIYNDGVVFVQLKEKDKDSIKIFEYNNETSEFSFVTKIETSGIKNIYILK